MALKTFTKTTSDSEIRIYEVLTIAAHKYNGIFSSLALPEKISSDRTTKELVLPYYEGKTFNDVWLEHEGGLSMGLSLTKQIPKVLAELGKIDITLFTDNAGLKNEDRLVFEYEQALRYFSDLAATFTKRGFFTQKELDAITDILRHKQTTKLIVSNGDFYPRNFIQRPDGKIVIIDWETWREDSNSPFYIIDHPENVAATIYVHMWGNKPWQKVFVEELQKTFHFTDESFKKGIVIKALSLAQLWSTRTDETKRALVGDQIKIIKEVL